MLIQIKQTTRHKLEEYKRLPRLGKEEVYGVLLLAAACACPDAAAAKPQ